MTSFFSHSLIKYGKAVRFKTFTPYISVFGSINIISHSFFQHTIFFALGLTKTSFLLFVSTFIKAGISAIVQPGGSIRDQESIDECNANGIAMVFTGSRHFKH